jgi:hypothetical protein
VTKKRICLWKRKRRRRRRRKLVASREKKISLFVEQCL